MTNRKRANRLECEQRVSTALSLIAQGASTAQIVALLMQSEGISERQAFRYVEEARKSIRGLGNQATDEERGLIIKRLELLYQNAFSQKDIKVANQVMANQIHLHKYRSKSHDLSHVASALEPELEAAIRALESKGQAHPQSD